MIKPLVLVLLVIYYSAAIANAREAIFSCKEEYDSDYNEHILTSTTITLEDNSYKLTIIDHYQLMDFFNNLYMTQNESIYSVVVLFSQCNFSKIHEWEVDCNRPTSVIFYDQKGNSIVTQTNMGITSGSFNTEEESKNWFFSSFGLSVKNKFAEIKAQFHPDDNCKK
jgi:hypothetical protein